MKKDEGKEVEYKVKSGTAWSHSYLNQKPWHPLSYPNQRRKWIAEQQNAQRDRKADEVSREVFPDFPSLSCLFLFMLFALVFWSFLWNRVSFFLCFLCSSFGFPRVWASWEMFLNSVVVLRLQFAQEQEFFRQTAEMSKREKAKVLLTLLLFSSPPPPLAF